MKITRKFGTPVESPEGDTLVENGEDNVLYLGISYNDQMTFWHEADGSPSILYRDGNKIFLENWFADLVPRGNFSDFVKTKIGLKRFRSVLWYIQKEYEETEDFRRFAWLAKAVSKNWWDEIEDNYYPVLAGLSIAEAENIESIALKAYSKRHGINIGPEERKILWEKYNKYIKHRFAEWLNADALI